VSTSIASIQTREINDMTKKLIVPRTHIDEPFKIDVKPFINRPFYVGSVRWSQNIPQYQLINNSIEKLPRDIINSNVSLRNGLKVGSLYRMAGQLSISVAGTIGHAGCVLVGIIPPLPNTLDYSANQVTLVNTILSGPHAFLHANEATSVLLDIPWYCNTDYDSLDVDIEESYKPAISLNNYPGTFATLVFLVLNQLLSSSGSSTALNITIEANLTNLEVAVPTPRYITYNPQSYFSNLGTSLIDSATGFAKSFIGDAIDGLRGAIRYYTGLHNPNLPQIQSSTLMLQRNRLNNVDTLQYMENLDPNANFVRIVQEPIFNTDVDEMALNHIIQKKQYIGTFGVNYLDPVGKLLFVRPISPYQGGLQTITSYDSELAPCLANNIEAIHLLTRAWSGNIKITIQSVMNNKQQVKLRLIQLYNPSPKVLTGYPDYQTVLQAPSHLLEFSAGGQTQEVILPYLARNQMLLNARDSTLEALLHGLYYIYVAQPLVYSSGSPLTAYFNVYISMEPGTEFYGYSTELMYANGPVNNPLGRIENYKPQSYVMNKPQKQDDKVATSIELHENNRLLPLVDIRPLIRRTYRYIPSSQIVHAMQQTNVVIELEDLIGENLNLASDIPASPCVVLSKMYYGKHVGLKMRVTVKTLDGDYNPSIRINFVPPQYFTYMNNIDTIIGAGLVTDNISGYSMENCVYPLNYTSIPVPGSSNDSKIFEFIIPNVSPLKFIGGPLKMIRETLIHYVKTASSDLGNVLLSIRSTTDSNYSITVEYSFTDETRLGFHCIAPIVERMHTNADPDIYDTPNVGTVNSLISQPKIELNPYLYYTKKTA